MIISVPMMIARGRLRCGSFTSPLANVRSAKPSYAHITEMSDSPNSPASTGAPFEARCDQLPPASPPMQNDAATRKASAPNLVIVESPANSAPSCTPMMFVPAAKAIAPAAR